LSDFTQIKNKFNRHQDHFMFTLTPDYSLLSPRYCFMVAKFVYVKVIIFSTILICSKLNKNINKHQMQLLSSFLSIFNHFSLAFCQACLHEISVFISSMAVIIKNSLHNRQMAFQGFLFFLQSVYFPLSIKYIII